MSGVWRFRFEKTGRMRFLSHLDLIRTMTRAFRRADLALAHSAGFHPHPMLAFGPALAVGIESSSEYCEAVLAKGITATDPMPALNRALPHGLQLTEAAPVQAPGPPMAAWLDTASYHFWLAGTAQALASLTALPLAEHLPVARRTADGGLRELDLKKLLLAWDFSQLSQGRLGLLTVAGQAGNLRPEDLLPFMPGVGIDRVLRTGLYHRLGDRLLAPMGGEVEDWRKIPIVQA